MDVQAECQALETKLMSVCQPKIYLNPDLYRDADNNIFTALVKQILNQIPVQIQQILIDENVFSGLQHFKDREFYSIFYNYLEMHQKTVQSVTYYTLLPYEQWAKKSFCAMKLRMIGLFIDILKVKNAQKQKQVARAQALKIQKQNADRTNDSDFVPIQKEKQGFQMPEFKFQYENYENKSKKRNKVSPPTYQRNYLPGQFVDIETNTQQMNKMTEQLMEKFRGANSQAPKEIDYVERQNKADDILLQSKIFQLLERLDAKIDNLQTRVDGVEGTVKALWMELIK